MFDTTKLKDLHDLLCHLRATRITHFVRTKNLPYSITEIKCMVARCKVCEKFKSRFYKLPPGHLIKATPPLERLSIDFKRPLPLTPRNRYIVTILYVYSRSPFAFICPDMHSPIVIGCLGQLFTIFGMSAYIHSDRRGGARFMSAELSEYLRDKGMALNHTTSYNRQGNNQTERLNDTLEGLSHKLLEPVFSYGNGRQLSLTSRTPSAHRYAQPLTARNMRDFNFSRRSTIGVTVSTWLTVHGLVNSCEVLIADLYVWTVNV